MGTKWHILFFKYLPFLKVNINVKFWSQQTYNILRHLASSILLAEIFYLLINALMCMGTCMAYFCISVHIALWLFWSHVATSLVYQLLSLILADWSNLLQIYHHFLFHEMFKCCLTWISYIIIDIVNSVYQLLQSSSYFYVLNLLQFFSYFLFNEILKCYLNECSCKNYIVKLMKLDLYIKVRRNG